MLGLLVGVVVIGVIVWAVTTYIPLPQPFRGIVMVIGILFCLLLVLRAFGGVDLSLPRLR